MKKIIKTIICLFLLLTICGCDSDKTVVVNFDSDGGSNVNAVVFNNDTSKLTKPADPTKDGYKFVEWQLNGKSFDFNLIIDKDITLKAVWSKNDGGGQEDKKDDKDVSEKVACTGLKALYHNYWAIEGPNNIFNLEVTVSPENCTDIPTYKSDDESIVKVDQKGNVTPGKIGKTTIHVTCGDQKLDIGFETRQRVIDVEKITIPDITVKQGEDAYIKVNFYPENATDKTLTYKSADTSKVSVNTDGKIVGLIPGPCIVYVTASDGITYECDIMVEGSVLDIDLPLYSEVSYKDGNYAPCRVYLHEYKDGKETLTDVWHDATLHSEGGEVELVGDKLFAHSDPIVRTETNVWFTYKDLSTIKVTIYVKP